MLLAAVEYDSHPLMLRRTIPALPFHIALLLVALFNALAGAPLHEAGHIQESVRSATASATAGNADALATSSTASSTASDDHSEETHTPCAWCLTHALEAGLAHAPARQPQFAAQASAIAPQRADSFTAQQVRWPFAARGPPPAQRA